MRKLLILTIIAVFTLNSTGADYSLHPTSYMLNNALRPVSTKNSQDVSRGLRERDYPQNYLVYRKTANWIEEQLRSIAGRISPYLIGVAAPAGAGKTTTIVPNLKRALEEKGYNVLMVGLDEFFKSPEERAILGTAFDRRHIRWPDLVKFMSQVKKGFKRIVRLKHVRQPRRMLIRDIVDLEGIDIVIFEGLYAISSDERLGNLLRFVNFPIYIDVETEIIEEMKRLQEARNPNPRTEEQMRVLRADELRDTEENILPSRGNASVIIHKDEAHSMEFLREPSFSTPDTLVGRRMQDIYIKIRSSA